MKILVFGGTTEGRVIAAELSRAGHEVVVSVATELGAEQLEALKDVSVHVGRLDVAEIAEILTKGHFDSCIDGTHPYATVVSANVREATSKAGVPYYRLLREAGISISYDEIEASQQAMFFDSAREVAAWCSENLSDADKVLLTTGSKEAGAYSECNLDSMYIRILPSEESYSLCKAAGFYDDHIIQAFGPFSEEANMEIIESLGITYLVSKDSGSTGGFPEKLSAARKTGITMLIIRRPVETGYSMNQILQIFSNN